MNAPLASRVALVTGASRGIGYATAIALARAGAEVIAVSRTASGLDALQTEAERSGGRITPFPLDLRDGAGIERLAAFVDERHGRLDILIGNAAVPGKIVPLAEIDLASWQEAFAVNVTANLHLIRAFDALLRRSDVGRVVVVSSGVAAMARPAWGTYTCTKAALEQLARTYAAETGDTPIRVNVLTPGPVRTDLYAAVMPHADLSTIGAPEPPAEKIVEMCLPEFRETGKIYNFLQQRLLSFRAPG